MPNFERTTKKEETIASPDGKHVRHVETEVRQGSHSVAQQPAHYTEEARRLDAANQQFDQRTKQLDKEMERSDKYAEEHRKQINELESEAQKAAKQVEKERGKHIKKEAKLQSELEKQEEKTMKIAQELAEKQTEQRRVEAQHAREAMAKEAEAKRLAGDLANKREHDRRFAEQKVGELALTERELKQKAQELAEHQQREVRELEIKQREMNTDVEAARKAMEELRRRHELEKNDFAQRQKHLEQLQNDADTSQQLAQKHNKERAELEAKMRDLNNKALSEEQRAAELREQEERVQRGLEAQGHALAQQQGALGEHQKYVQSKQEQHREIEIHAKDQLKNEELALKKARDLAAKTEAERKDQQKDLSRLSNEEQAAKRKAEQLTEVNVKVEEKPATIDVYEHKKMQTTEPVVTELNVKEHRHELKEGTASTEHEENKSLPKKIVDKVKNIF